MKKFINSFLFLILNLCNYNCFADTDFIDRTINNLLQEQISDERILLEQQYTSKNQIEKIRIAQEKIESITLEQFNPRYSTFQVKINYSDGKMDVVSGSYISYIMIPIAARYIKFGDIILAGDVSTKKIRLDILQEGYMTETKEVIGMQAKKYIAIGKMFYNNDITRPNVIKNGDPVNIVYSSGVINLKTVGTAMGAGAVGDMVKVKNNSSGIVLLGEVINKNTVKIGGENE